MGSLDKLALVSDALEQLYPNSDIGVYVLLKEDLFKENISAMGNMENDLDKFSINISGVDFIFVLNRDG